MSGIRTGMRTISSAEDQSTNLERSVSGGSLHQKQSAGGAQPGQRDPDKAANRGLGWQAARCREGVEQVARELIGGDVIPDVALLDTFDQQIAHKPTQLLLRSDDMLTSMQECGELGAVLLEGVEQGD